MMRRILLAAVAAALVTGVAACGERPQVVEYKQGKYQGKLDQKPYEGAQFNGNQLEWERAIRARNQLQNEYKRTN
jgi:hypothetical protein